MKGATKKIRLSKKGKLLQLIFILTALFVCYTFLVNSRTVYKASASENTYYTLHTVEAGETAWKLWKENSKVSFDEFCYNLERDNGINSGELQPGMSLMVRVGE